MTDTAPAPDPLVTGSDGRARCGWVRADAGMAAYHDEEWGVPLHGERALFEKLSLEGFQSGLSWIVVLRKRQAFRRAFAGFDPDAVARFAEADVDRLLADASIVRNRPKILAVIANAAAIVDLRDRRGEQALDELVWSHAPAARPPHERPAVAHDVPASTPESVALSRALRAEGLRFVGPVTAYALMQSGGLVDDHLAGCWRAG